MECMYCSVEKFPVMLSLSVTSKCSRLQKPTVKRELFNSTKFEEILDLKEIDFGETFRRLKKISISKLTN